MIWPVFSPPPAIQRKPASGQWLRPSGVTSPMRGVRPNSPPISTTTSSSRPRSSRSVTRAVQRLVERRQQLAERGEVVRVRVPVVERRRSPPTRPLPPAGGPGATRRPGCSTSSYLTTLHSWLMTLYGRSRSARTLRLLVEVEGVADLARGDHLQAPAPGRRPCPPARAGGRVRGGACRRRGAGPCGRPAAAALIAAARPCSPGLAGSRRRRGRARVRRRGSTARSQSAWLFRLT